MGVCDVALFRDWLKNIFLTSELSAISQEEKFLLKKKILANNLNVVITPPCSNKFTDSANVHYNILYYTDLKNDVDMTGPLQLFIHQMEDTNDDDQKRNSSAVDKKKYEKIKRKVVL